MSTTFSKEEKAAMRAAAAEAKAAKEGADMVAACAAAIAELSGTDRELAEIVDQLVKKNTSLSPKTWYGMPAYADSEGKVVVFFQSASKFKVRFATIGFQPPAHLDEGNFWPTSYAVTKLTAADQKQVAALLKKAAG